MDKVKSEMEHIIDGGGICERASKPRDCQVGGDHYKNMKIQRIDFCFENKLNVYQSDIIKYLVRYKNKNGKIDLQKARHLIDMLIEVEYPSCAGVGLGPSAVATPNRKHKETL